MRPIDIIINPLLDTSYDGLGNLDFVPAARVAYNFSSGWALALEEYADFGPLHEFRSRRDQAHQVYGVVDVTTKTFDVEAGVGVGMTAGSDDLTFKLILARDLNRKR